MHRPNRGVFVRLRVLFRDFFLVESRKAANWCRLVFMGGEGDRVLLSPAWEGWSSVSLSLRYGTPPLPSAGIKYDYGFTGGGGAVDCLECFFGLLRDEQVR